MMIKLSWLSTAARAASRMTCVTGIATMAAVAFTPVPSLAGSCPPDKMGVDLRKPDSTPAKDVTDMVLGSMDLATEPVAIKGRQLRLRKLVVKPGGVVPWHSHSNRPAIIYIQEGEIYEYASNCSVPILHKAGETTAETHVTSHWWKNTGTQTVVIIAADLFPVGDDQHQM
jgi:quercetin dioxygenase-like cupin family protein